MTSWHSYPKIWNMGHAAIAELFFDEVTVEEKIDGSQFSFGYIDGELKIRSKGQEMLIEAPEAMFSKAAETVKSLAFKLRAGWTYRGEYLRSPAHNTLCYGRVPEKNIILFDINPGEESYLSYEEKKQEAERIGLECVPIILFGKVESPAQLIELLDRESCLGKAKIEGLVVKNYKRFGLDKKVLMGKHVSEAFKESHLEKWPKNNPGKADILDIIKEKCRTEARWIKAEQHLKERGELTNHPKDIPALMKEVMTDGHTELRDPIMETLFNWAWPQISRSLAKGLPEWYKKRLLEKQFEGKE